MMMMMMIMVMMMNMSLMMTDDDVNDDGDDDTWCPFTETTHFVLPKQEKLKAATLNVNGPDASK